MLNNFSYSYITEFSHLNEPLALMKSFSFLLDKLDAKIKDDSLQEENHEDYCYHCLGLCSHGHAC